MHIGLFFLLLISLAFSSQLLTRSLSSFFHKVTGHEGISVRLMAIFFLPGVILHELAHAIMAYVLFVPVGKIEFVPVIDGDHVKLGSVQVGKADPIRRMLIGVAPILLGLSLLFGVLFFFLPREIVFSHDFFLKSALLLYTVFVIGNTMFSSRRDLEGSAAFLVVLGILLAVLFVAGVRLPEAFLEYVQSERVQELFKSGSIFLAVPLAINGVVIFVVRVLFGTR